MLLLLLLLLLLLRRQRTASRLEGDRHQPWQRGTGPTEIIDVHRCVFWLQ
ncbi:hypothetical protein ACQ859_16550 [Roseateles chitinivorans]